MSKLFESDWGNESLREIVEVEFPEPVSLVPSTPGWWILLLGLVGLMARSLWRRRQRYLRDRYRRDALAQLATIKQHLEAGKQEAVRELAPLLRATAVAAGGRDLVSGLEGDDYAAALAGLSPGKDHLSVSAIGDLQLLAYAPLDEVSGMDTQRLESLMTAMGNWIQNHKGDYA